MSQQSFKKLCDLVTSLNKLSEVTAGMPISTQVNLGYADGAQKLLDQILLEARELALDTETKSKLVQHAQWTPKVEALTAYLSSTTNGTDLGSNSLDVAREQLMKARKDLAEYQQGAKAEADAGDEAREEVRSLREMNKVYAEFLRDLVIEAKTGKVHLGFTFSVRAAEIQAQAAKRYVAACTCGACPAGCVAEAKVDQSEPICYADVRWQHDLEDSWYTVNFGHVTRQYNDFTQDVVEEIRRAGMVPRYVGLEGYCPNLLRKPKPQGDAS